MRRIIERVVTVVTTTTWKISWEAEPSHTAPEDLPHLEILPEPTPPSPTVIETKEVHPPEEENTPDRA